MDNNKPIILTIGGMSDKWLPHLNFRKGHKHFAGYMYSLRKPIFVLVKDPLKHTIFASRYGGGDTVMIDAWSLQLQLNEIAAMAKEVLFPKGGAVPAITEPSNFFKLEAGFCAFHEDGNKMSKKCDIRTPCRADFLICIHGVYTYDKAATGTPKMKLVVKASQMKVTATAVAAAPKTQFAFDECML